MPVSILTPQQRNRYGRFATTPPTPGQIAKQCFLTPAELSRVVARRREPWQQLGFAVQLMTVRFLGTFLDSHTVLNVPQDIIAFGARQLGLPQVPDMNRYADSPDMIQTHRDSIRNQFGYLNYSEAQSSYERWLRARIVASSDSLIELFDLSTAWCIKNKVLLPAATRLERDVARIHDATLHGLWSELAAIARGHQGLAEKLQSLRAVSEETGRTQLDELQRAPTKQNSNGMRESEQRVLRLQEFGGATLDVNAIPPARIHQLAEAAVLAKSSQINQLEPTRQLATLLAFVVTYEVIAVDDFLSLFDVVITQLLSASARDSSRKRLDGLHELDVSALLLATMCDVVLDETVPDAEVRPVAFAKVTRDDVAAAIAVVRSQCKAGRKDGEREELVEKHRRIAGALTPIVRTLALQAGPNGQQVLKQTAFIRRTLDDGAISFTDAPLDGLSKQWRERVVDRDGKAIRGGYLAWVGTRLREALRRHDVFVARSVRWASVEANMIPADDAWVSSKKPEVCVAFGFPERGDQLVTRLETELTNGYRDAQTALGSEHGRARFENGELIVEPIGANEIPESRRRLRDHTSALMPMIDLADLVMEVQAKTNFMRHFVPSTHSLTREADIERTLCAALVADACNLPYTSIADPDVPALTEERIAYVDQQFLRPDTITAANEELIAAQNRILLVRRHWGVGHVAAADGLRFRVPVAAPNAMPNRKYFGSGKGITYFSPMSDQYTGLPGIVVTGTMRDSLFLLENRMQLRSVLEPVEIMTDMASVSDAVFALFWFQGYEFRPRYTDLGDARYWRFDRAADYGSWNSVSRNVLDRALITSGYDDVLRLNASLREGRINARNVMQMLGGYGRPQTLLGKATSEIGRVFKTKHMLRLASDAPFARRINTHLNHAEQRNGVARQLFYGRRGELHQTYVTGQENQLGALGFVLNAMVLWNTLYLDAALASVRTGGLPIDENDIAHLTPLTYAHIRVEGRYQFNRATDLGMGKLRALRIPKVPSIFRPSN